MKKSDNFGQDQRNNVRAAKAATNDNRASDERLDQYYTRPDVATHCYAIFQQHVDPAAFLLVEPSAGTGSFLKVMPAGSVGYDVEPKFPGIWTADFLTVRIDSDRDVAIVGNPPFGRNAGMAVRFFNHAAAQASVIAFILPRTFRKGSIENRLHRNFHLIREEPVPRDAFLFRGKPFSMPAVFQIWERRPYPRPLRPIDTCHPDFAFVTPDRANFAIQRVGARAGRLHHDFTASPSSHYFIRGHVEPVMARIDFRSVAADVAGNPSLSKAEIVELYHKRRYPMRVAHPKAGR